MKRSRYQHTLTHHGAGGVSWRQPLLAAVLAIGSLGVAAQAAPPAPASVAAAPIDLPDGGRYRGPTVDGKLHGRGRIDWGAGRSYVGQFVNGFMHGQGHLKQPDYDYRGAFRRGAMHGQGRLRRGEDMVYEGAFVNDRMHGHGRITLGDGMVYEGQFQRDKPSGPGRMTYPSGAVIEGRFDGYDPVGTVTLRWPTGDRFEGPLAGMAPNGPGVWTRPDQATVRGTFAYGNLEGKGRIQYADGAVYEGPVQRARAHGRGELRRANGEVYQGRFANDQFDGQGSLRHSDGTVQEGYWRAGKYLGATGDGTLDDTPELALRNNQTVLYNQQALLKRQFDPLKASEPGAPRMYALYVAGDGSEEVFRREVRFVDDLLARRFDTRGRSVSLVNSRSSAEQLPLATAHSIGLALQALAQKMDRQRDLLFVFLTSHGSRTHELSLGMNRMALPDLSAKQLGDLLKASGIRNQVIVVSACYSGGFVPALQGERTWVITASRADRTSFGCSDDNDLTYFGRALFEQSLPHASTLTAAVERARELVKQWEARDAAERAEARKKAAAAAPAAKAPRNRPDAAGKDEESEPQSVVQPAFQAEVDAWVRERPAAP